MIFLHSSFRTGSTFLWNRLRELPGAIAFYEVFHEILATCTPETIERTAPDGSLRHPDTAPYFREFVPLLAPLPEAGIPGFDASFALATAIPRDGCRGAISPAETAYVQRLVSHARGEFRLPVLTCVRSLGRIAGLRDAAPGLHLLLHRNLFRQWCSYSEQHHHGNPYFLDCTRRMVEAATHDAMIRRIAEKLPGSDTSPRNPQTFLMFALLHLHLYAQSAGVADALVSLERLEHDPSHRAEIETLLKRRGAPASLAGVRNSITYSLLPPDRAGRLLDELREAARPVIDAAPDQAGHDFATAMLDELVSEYERHEFQTAALRRAFLDAEAAHERASTGS